jgi:hypothetical protein
MFTLQFNSEQTYTFSGLCFSEMAKASPSNLLLMFDRPTEPVFMPKGENNTVFDVPSEYLVSLPTTCLS